MGCDIHMVLERRDHEKTRWVAIDTFHEFKAHQNHRDGDGVRYCDSLATARNYRRFAALARVRGDGPDPRGVPGDISDSTEFLIRDYGVDGHSHSWLPLADAARIFAETQWIDEPLTDWQKERPADFYFGIYAENDLSDYRLIFWFDN